MTIKQRIKDMVEDTTRDMFVTVSMNDDEHDEIMAEWDNRLTAIDLIIKLLQEMKGSE